MKTNEVHKFFIESFIINDENDPKSWDDNDWLRVTKGHAVIGYLFSTKLIKFGIYGKALNLYLINKKYYRKSEVDLKDIKIAYKLFCSKCSLFPNQKDYKKRMVFQNPPIEEWLETKGNWITKTASELSERWQITYDSALSSIYLIIVEFYHRGDVYMGNLSYIKIGILNLLRGQERHDRNRLYGKNVISGEAPRYIDKEGNIESWFDTVGEEDPSHLEREYLDFVEDIKRFMSKDFSERELEQIFKCEKVTYLPQNLYVRLLRWRAKHTRKEVLSKL